MPYQKPGQTQARCKAGAHVAPIEEFNGRWRETPNGTVWHLDPSCRFHQESKRHEEKEKDLALYIVTRRADDLARKTGTTRDFIMRDPRGPQWERLIPLARVFLDQHATCLNCGREFDGTRDMQFDHIHAPRFRDDWARHHARNIRILCGSSNNGKRQKDDALWIDEQYRWQLLDADRVEIAPKECGCDRSSMCLLCMGNAGEATGPKDGLF